MGELHDSIFVLMTKGEANSLSDSQLYLPLQHYSKVYC